MTKRGVAVVGVGLALVAVCGLSALVLYGTYGALRATGARLSVLSTADTPATVRITETYRVGAVPRLVVDTAAGGITVTVGSAGVIEVETVKTAWGEDAAAARTAAADLTVTARQEGDTLTLSYEQPEEMVIMGGRRGADTVGFNVKVPLAAAVALDAAFGDIRLAGTAGPAEVRSSFGAVTVEDLGGPLTAGGNTGGERALPVAGTAAATAVGVTVLTATSNAGAVTVRRLRTDGAVTVSSDFGAVTLVDVVGSAISATTKSGAVTVDGAEAGESLTVGSDFGPVTVRRARAGAFEISSSNGAVTVEAPVLTGDGRLAVHSSFGPVRVTDARDAVLALESENGAVSFAGTLGAGRGHTARSSFGDVEVAIPANSRLDVTLSTDFGQASTDLPLMVQGEIDDQKIAGTLNGGGPSLEIRSNNGDVSLDRYEPGS